MVRPGPQKRGSDFELKPHQKFAGQFISPLTDFPGELVYHRLGSGKCTGYNTPIVMYDGSIQQIAEPMEVYDCSKRTHKLLK